MDRKETGYTFIGVNFLRKIIFDLLHQSSDVYILKNFSKRQFQVAINENTPAAIGFISIAAGIEAYRNILFHMKRRASKNRSTVANEIAYFISEENSDFPTKLLADLITEIFIVRDVIFHGHVYKVTLTYDKDWNFKAQRHTLIKGYGDKKFQNYVNSRTKKTKSANLNVQPIKIGFEDLFKAIVILDILIATIEEYWGKKIINYHPFFLKNQRTYETISEILTYFYDKIPSPKFKDALRIQLATWKKEYGDFLSYDKPFINNICYRCGEFGFKKGNSDISCHKCGTKIEFYS